MGCVEGHKCAVVPACDATCTTAKAEAQTKALEAQAKIDDDCQLDDAEGGCKEKALKAAKEIEDAAIKAKTDSDAAYEKLDEAAKKAFDDAKDAKDLAEDAADKLLKDSKEECVLAETCDTEGYVCGAMQLGATLVSAVAIMNLM